MSIKIPTIFLFIIVMALLITQRIVSIPEQFRVYIQDAKGTTSYLQSDELQRGQIIETKNDFLFLEISEDINLWMSENTTIELTRLFEDELILTFTRGRIVISNQSNTPLTLKTNHTSHIVHQDVASFVNYDFLETIHVIPLTGAVQVHIPSTGEQMLTPVGLSIHETDPVSFEPLKIDLEASDAAEFYQWVKTNFD